jgi:hypothetical protein
MVWTSRGITLVGTRGGKPVVYWPGVVLALVIVLGLNGGAYLLSLLAGSGLRLFFIAFSLINTVVDMLLFVWLTVLRLRLPPEELPRLDNGT